MLGLLGLITFASVFSSTFATSDRFSTPAQDAEWAERRAALEDVIELDPDAEDPWVNTVKVSHITEGDYLSLPYGVGINTGWADPRYVVLGHADYEDSAERDTDLENLQTEGREIIYDDECLTVLAKP